MKKLLTLLYVIISSINITSAQNLLKSITYSIEKYKIEKVTGNKESHVYPDVTELKVHIYQDEFGKECTNFSFINAGGEQSFNTWYKEETIHENNIVQKLSMLEGLKSKPTMVYFKTEKFNEKFIVLVVIPDVKNGIHHKFTLSTTEANFTPEHLAEKIKERATWNEFRAAMKKILNTEDISTLKGEAIEGLDFFKCTINPIGFNEKAKFRFYEKDSEHAKHIVFHISSLRVWMGKYQTTEQMESDIKRVETILNEEISDEFTKVYTPQVVTIGDMLAAKIGKKEKNIISDNIFYLHPSEEKAELSTLTKTYLEVEIKISEYNNEVYIKYFQK